MRTLAIWTILMTLNLAVPATGQERKNRDELVRDDLAEVVGDGFWIYNDLPKGILTAQLTGKPLLVVFRCIPCENCAQLDSEIAERDPAVRELLEKFVCVRIVHANGMDLSLFQFDYDQSFAAFFMNADKTIYGRYGTRSHQTESADDVALEGFAAALEGALALHKAYPDNAAALAGKQSQEKPRYAVPEEFPELKDKYDAKLNYEGAVAQSCIHCHQVAESLRATPRNAGEELTDKILFPYPHPKSLGLILDPKTMATVKEVRPDSIAAASGLQAGDQVESLAGQPLLSMADVQWVLHHAPAEGTIEAQVVRNGQPVRLQWTLDEGWRRRDNLSWRASAWAMRRMVTGGMLLEDAPEELRQRAGLADDALALFARHVGEYGAHALAKQSGFVKGDVLVSIDGRAGAMREADLFVHLLRTKKVGDEIPVTVWRDGKEMQLKLRMQE
jgi:hypothetical protein